MLLAQVDLRSIDGILHLVRVEVEGPLDLNLLLLLLIRLELLCCLYQVNLQEFLVGKLLVTISNSVAFLSDLVFDVRKDVISQSGFLMRIACLLVISAFLALALAGARDATFEAFAVLLLAHGVLAVAALEVLLLVHVHFAFERLDVSFQDFFDGSPPFFNVRVVVEAVPVLVALAFWTTRSVISQAFTVKLQAFCVPAFAALAPNESRLHLLPLEQLRLRNGPGHDLGGLFPDLLF